MTIARRYRQIALLLVLGTTIVLPAYADSVQPGSADDPVVTKSYVDQVLAQKGVGSQPSITEEQVKQLVSAEVEKVLKNSNSTSGGTTTAALLEVVTLQLGQTLMAGAGTEFIVRTGKTVAVSNDGDGIPDVTAGKDIAAGTAIELNHLLIFPKEGRGIKADPKGKDDIYVMVRGKYLLIRP